ncbi:Ig-like domain-containing protein [Arthrobacter sp. zg-Y20]|uniref:Ig-like domain-containing protein n=1 Tax=unclassified Arthrobacter TaxID=235627 RepID=UPI001D134B8F|nr:MULTISPECIES: Ig-like domain-containing protein [unclassified Arthrobacter]MCC3277282.1 Ig-like domain-containing protein [Arthrobacter sp. zg-Y20]MDK1317442.1 Ig-like domain-containing protein [Arthrobacter sp. zg.Y20]WIB07214.1 Ig-like domain-containing protein [Arthrobacter sp. zg-Y20]
MAAHGGNARLLSRKRRRAVSVGSAVAVTAGLVTGALLYPGFASADVDLNDGGVWVTNRTQGMVGHLNYPSRLLDGGYTANSDNFDVLQNAGTVFNLNTDQSKASPVDVANVARGAEVQLPGAAEFSFGGDTVAITDPAQGRVWITPASDVGFFSEDDAKPVLDGKPGVLAAVSSEDHVVVAAPSDGILYTFEKDEDGEFGEPETREAAALKDFKDAQIAAVGARPVVLNTETETLLLPNGETVSIPEGKNAKLQQSGPESEFVAVATEDALILQPLDGGKPEITELDSGGGGAAAPVRLGDCVYAAWAGSGTHVRDCGNDAEDTREDIPGLSPSSELVFRVNRDVVVLNDVNGGGVWLVLENMQLVDNWGDVIPPEQSNDDDEEEAASENPVNALPDRTTDNRAPVASDDTVGARAGRTTILQVLENDSDPDGDLLTASVVGDMPMVGGVEPIYNGAALQIVVPLNTPAGTGTFTYQVSDGRGGTDTASVSVRVVGAGENTPPEPRRNTKILLEQGKSVSQNVLNDWKDADGDDLVLISAEPTEDGDQVRPASDGLLDFRDVGKTQGVKEVAITVSDGTDEVKGTVTYDVRPSGVLPPVANFDHVTTTVDQPVQMFPLKNDLDPAGGQLTLAKAEGEKGVVVTPDYQTGSIGFMPTEAGTYYIEYLVTNGPQSASGLIRVDANPSGRGGVPVAVRDVALLPRGESVLVDVLGNDTDPTGGILVVQSVRTPDDAPVNVAVLDRHLLQIHDTRSLRQQMTIEYSVSNGTAAKTGEVNIIPVEQPATLLPPTAGPDEAVVRVGDVVTIPVLDNDSSPTGGELTLNPVLPQPVDPQDGQMFVSDNKLRFVAGQSAKTVYAIYEVSDETGQKNSAQVRINIRPRDDEKNTPPVPVNVEGRVVAGTTVRIPIPLDGLDADGDSVVLNGIGSAPTRGAALAGPNYIDYTALAQAAGTDSFTYTVRDRLGVENTGTVQVGIAPAAQANQKPVAVEDTVTLRPGRSHAASVLRNDSDPDGDPISLNTAAVTGSDPALETRTDLSRVLLKSPKTPGAYGVTYGVKDNRGGVATGNVMVVVDEDAPLLPPTSRDDLVDASETRDKSFVEVPVLENDEDPDGLADDMSVRIMGDYPSASVSGGKVRVDLTNEAQIIPYTAEDQDGGTSSAIIWVPGLSTQYPMLREGEPLEVQAGSTLDLNLKSLVVVRNGRTPRITTAEHVRAIGTKDGGARIMGASSLRYAPDPDYSGLGSVTFEVTDGAGPEDPEGLKATLTVLVNVIPLPEQNYPPTISSGSLETAKGEPEVTLDLAGLASDPNPEDASRLRFKLAADVPNGFDGEIDGSVLKIRAADDAAVGTTGELWVSVSDGRGEPVRGRVDLTVIASMRALPVAADDVVPDAVQGRPVTVPVLDNDFNPFQDRPLEIVEVRSDANGTAVLQGSNVVVTPGSEFVGSMNVQYIVRDRTGEVSRRAAGQIRLTVQGKPNAPSTPMVESTRSRTVVLAWNPPAANGSPITGYTVTAANGFSQACPATTCTLTGLTNNVEYVFRVTASNAHGTSAPSPTSAVARPDTQPGRPAPPTLVYGDRELKVAWTAPPNDGSPITGYDLQISPAPPNGAVQKSAPAAGGTLVWSGLDNGTSYRVRIQARNSAPDPSEWSDYSAPEHPNGLPGAPGAPSTSSAPSVGKESQLTVEWGAAPGNGAEILAYQVYEYQGSNLIRTIPAGRETRVTITVPNSEQDYSYAVQAQNRSGWGETGPQSAPRRARGIPDGPPAPVLEPAETAGAGRAVKVTFQELNASQRNGAKADEIAYVAVFSNGNRQQVRSGDVVRGFTNGGTVSAQIMAVVTVPGSTYDGQPGPPSGDVMPYGAPGLPTVTGTDGKPLKLGGTVTWTPPDSGSFDVHHLEARKDDEPFIPVYSDNTVLGKDKLNEAHSFEVRAVNSRGEAGAPVKVTVNSGRYYAGTATAHTCWRNPDDSVSGDCSGWGGVDAGSEVQAECTGMWKGETWLRVPGRGGRPAYVLNRDVAPAEGNALSQIGNCPATW